MLLMKLALCVCVLYNLGTEAYVYPPGVHIPPKNRISQPWCPYPPCFRPGTNNDQGHYDYDYGSTPDKIFQGSGPSAHQDVPLDTPTVIPFGSKGIGALLLVTTVDEFMEQMRKLFSNQAKYD